MESATSDAWTAFSEGRGFSPIPDAATADRALARPGLTIRVSGGSGVGLTRLAAFDGALLAAGVGDFNLVRLSSVIPPGSTVHEVGRPEQIRGGHGDLLFCVYADAYASTPGEEAWAGVAWAQRDDGSGAGLFVEHAGASQLSVERDLAHSLEAISLSRALTYRPVGQLLASAVCTDHPVCAVSIATYRRVSWDNDSGDGCAWLKESA